MNVLSLFNGASCGNVAGEKAGLKFEKYYTSEINKYAIIKERENYPNNIQLGDVTKWQQWDIDWSSIDLLIGGSPCQNLSSSNVSKETKGLNGVKSRLFYTYIDILNHIKTINPNVKFLLENVGSAKIVDRNIINKETGVEGIKFNSRLLIPQNRNRVYWTNIEFELPTTLMTKTMQDILENSVDDKYYLTQKMYDCVMKPASRGWQSGKMETDLRIARPLTATMHKMHRADTDNYITTDYKPTGKTNLRRLTPIECERLQGLPDGYTKGISDTQRYIILGNGWTVDVIAHILKNLK